LSFTNVESTVIARQMGTCAADLSYRTKRLSSGRRILNPVNDAGGFSFHAKLDSSNQRHHLAMQNLGNALSYSQSQTKLASVGMQFLDRMSQLTTMAMDSTLNSADRENYDKEMQELTKEYQNLFRKEFNGISLFDIASGCGTQSLKVSDSQAGTNEERVYEIDTINGSGVAKIDQFSSLIPDLFRVYHGDVLIHERVSGSSAFPSYIGGVNSGNAADVSEYFGDNYTPEPFQDVGEDGVGGTGDTGEGNGEYDIGEPFTDQSSGTRDGVPILNGNYDGYGPQEQAFLTAQGWTGSEGTNPTPGDQSGTRSVFKYGPNGTDINGNSYSTDSTILRVVINEGGASISDTDLSPQATEWEYEIEVIPESKNQIQSLMSDGHGTELNLTPVGLPSLFNSSINSVSRARDVLEEIKKAQVCLMGAISQASANVQRLNGEISENQARISSGEEAASRIMDLDVADESLKYAKAKLRFQSIASIISKAQIIPQAILSLLQKGNL
jgi:flagellin-like hook-associated protein FlgL